MRLWRLIEGERASDFRTDDAFDPKVEQLVHPTSHSIDLTPHMSEVNTKDALVRTDKRHRRELKPGHIREGLEHIEKIALLGVRGRGEAEHSEPSRRGKQAVAFLERFSSDGVEHELNALARGNFPRASLEVLAPLVYQMIDPEGFQLVMFCSRGHSNNSSANMQGDLRRRYADATAGRVNEHRLPVLKAAHDDDQLPGGEVIYQQRCPLIGRHVGGAREDLLFGNAKDVGISAKTRQREHVAAELGRIGARPHGIDPTSDLISDDYRQWRQVGIDAHTPHDVGEIDTARLHSNTDFARFWFWVRGFFNHQRLGAAWFNYPNLSHRGSLRLGGRVQSRQQVSRH
jgi:hypothetical protein